MALANQKWKEAQNDFKLAIDLEPDNPKLYHARGLGYQAHAENLALTVQPRDLETEDNRVEKAIFFFNMALSKSETFISSMFHLGLMYRKTNKFHEALIQFTRVQQQLPNDKTVYI